MSNKPQSTDSIRYPGPIAADTPGRAIEPWFTVLMSALAPLIGALFVPAPWRTALHVLGGVLCACGLILLARHEMIIRRQRNVTDR